MEKRLTEPSPPSVIAPPTAPESHLSTYVLSERQSIVVHPKNWANDLLYGGAKGGGKSWLFRYLFCLLCKAAPGILCYLFRRTYDELWGNHMEGPDAFPVMLQHEVYRRECAIVRKEVRWANGSRIFLRHMQLEKHKYNYQGKEIHAAAFDEATQFTETQIRYVLMSVRFGSWRPKLDLTGLTTDQAVWIRNLTARLPLWLFGANPGGVSHDFIKSRYVDLGPYKIKRGNEPGDGGTNRQFVPARAEDNPELLKNDPHYLLRLEIGGDPVLIRAMKEGDWSIVAGSMFGDVWRRERLDEEGDIIEWHVMKARLIPSTWPLWRGGDDGFANPSAIYWQTQDPDTDTIYVVSEIYAAGLTAPELGERILQRDREIPMLNVQNNQPIFNTEELQGTYDSNAFAETGRRNEISRGDQMNRMGCKWHKVEKGPGSRVARVQNLHRLLKPNKKERGRRPGIVFFDNCIAAIETIPKIMRDEKDREDVSEQSILHPFDGVTYGTQHRSLKVGRARVGL